MKWGKAEVCLLTLFILIAGGPRGTRTFVPGGICIRRKKPGRISRICAQWKLVAAETLGARLPARDVGGSLGRSLSLPLSQRKGLRLGISPAGSTSC